LKPHLIFLENLEKLAYFKTSAPRGITLGWTLR